MNGRIFPARQAQHIPFGRKALRSERTEIFDHSKEERCSQLDENGTKLMEDAFKASFRMIPEPARTLVPRYFAKSFKEKPADAE